MRLRSNYSTYIPHFVVLQLIVLLYCLYILTLNFEEPQEQNEKESFPISRLSSQRHLEIMIVMIVGNIEEAENEYSIALNSVRCYCNMHKYKFELVSDKDYLHLCPQKDFMFRRHCIVANLLQKSEWILFLDADVAVLNPNILIAEYIDEKYDLTLYDRFVNSEVAAGSYIVRNTSWSSEFLRSFADFEQRLPSSFHGTDNGALHVFIQERFYPHLQEDANVCLKIWEQSTSFETLYIFEACYRSVMGENRIFENARILKKGTGWVRDIWLTNSEWSPKRDFMVHGLKDSNMISYSQGFIVNLIYGNFNWRSPFKSKMNLEKCNDRTNMEKWEYDELLIVSSQRVEEYLKEKYIEVEKIKWKHLASVAPYV